MPYEPKTKPTDASVADFLDAVPHAGRREDGKWIAAMMAEVSGETPVLWGPSIVGFGTCRMKTGDWPLIGFSPRKANMVFYLSSEFEGYDDLMARLGKHRTSVACLYINRLADVDRAVLHELTVESVKATRARYPS